MNTVHVLRWAVGSGRLAKPPVHSPACSWGGRAATSSQVLVGALRGLPSDSLASGRGVSSSILQSGQGWFISKCLFLVSARHWFPLGSSASSSVAWQH